MHCDKCEKYCSDDYFAITFTRFKNNEVYVPDKPTLILCADCYIKLYDTLETIKEFGRSSHE